MKKFLLILLAIIIVAAVIAYFAAGYTYSEGSRAGVLIKFSHKGYVFKTYEGDLNIGGLGNVPNTAQGNVIWKFSVNDKAMAEKLLTLEGLKVSLHYKQIVKAMPWQGKRIIS